jgi:hypothetical protein
MMPYTFTENAARRIVAGVRKIEGAPQDRTGRQPVQRRPETLEIWAEIIGEDPSNPGNYSWKKAVPEDGQLEDWTPIVPATAEFTAYEINGREGLTAGDKVLLVFIGYDAAGKARYLFSVGAPLPQGQYQWTSYVQVAQNIGGFDFIRAHALVENPS